MSTLINFTSMKKRNSALALLGGKAIIPKPPPRFIWPPITKEVEMAVVKQLHETISIYDRSNIFEDFENSFASYHKRKYALLCSSGTLAIHSMFVAAGFKERDEVICPAYTFFATVSPLLSTGAVPVFCDAGENGNIDPREIERKITKKTKGVVVTHMWGIPCEMDAIVKICKKNKILLLEDCSHAHGARYGGNVVGSFGDLAAWSLQGQKNVTGGEGGILVTDNDEFYYRALLLGHYNKRCKQEIPKMHPLAKYAVTGMGLKYRAHPLAIAVARVMFKNMENYLQVKDFFAEYIISNLQGTRGLRMPSLKSSVRPSWYALVFQYHGEELGGLPIERFAEALHAEGLIDVDLPGSTAPLNLLPLFQTPNELFPNYSFSYAVGDFPRVEKFYKNAVKLPVWAFRKDKFVVNAYIKGIKKVLIHYKDLLNK